MLAVFTPLFSLSGFYATLLDLTIFLRTSDRRSAILPSATYTYCVLSAYYAEHAYIPGSEESRCAYVCVVGVWTISSAVQSTKPANAWSGSGVGPFLRHLLHILLQVQACDVVDFSAPTTGHGHGPTL